MKNALIVFRKEFYRVISDKRLLFMSVFLPGLAIFVMYSFMGNAIGNETEDIETHEIIVYVENMPAGFQTLVDANDREFDIRDFEDSTYDDITSDILVGDVDVMIRFPENFETTVLDYENPDYVIPEILTYYNPGERYSNNAYWELNSVLNEYAYAINYGRHGDNIYAFYMDLDNQDHIIIDEEKATGQGFAMLLPMLIIMFLFSGAMSIGPDSIAGEKERGTIATLLVTPIKRSELAIGKVLSLSIISLMSATSSFVGIMLSLPKLMQGQELSADIYGITEFLQIFGILLATVLVIVGLVSVISAFAKTIKEASMLILPFYFISIIIGVSTMFSGEPASNPLVYLIPIYSSVNMLIAIMTFEATMLHYVLVISSSLVYVVILIFVMNKLFESEKVMFSK